MSHLRLSATVVAFASLATLGILSCPSAAADKEGIDKIADALRKGDFDGAKKLAAATAKNLEDISDLMVLFKAKGNAGKNAAKNDGHFVAAVAEVMLARNPKNPAKGFAQNLHKAGLALAGAKGANAPKVAAAQVSKACADCHAVFK